MKSAVRDNCRRPLKYPSQPGELGISSRPASKEGVCVDPNFWHQRWKLNEIAFHEREANPLLVKYFDLLSLSKGSRVFLPLCGKTLAIHWLLSNGYRVVGSELSEIAVKQLFSELAIEPIITTIDQIRCHSADNIDIFIGDLFDLYRGVLGRVDAIYDRAALVAFPETMRNRYAAHLMEITDRAPQLLICLDYDQSLLDGPPFSVTEREVHRHYKGSYDLTALARVDVVGGLKGKCPAKEHVWLLKPRRTLPARHR
jgi:thiopurine S-methyltransferase